MPRVAPPPEKAFCPEPTPHRKRWTRDECAFLSDSGLLAGRYELIDGQILSKMGQKPPHRLTVVLLHAWLTAVFGLLFVQSQLPIDVGDADPEHNDPATR
ncbi:MAG TPA: hypothetical protein VFB38_16815 [Chthonomonadaceae bacterium]|nr:hypothetical protein [Chthonomonadaceae bacterium]